MWVFADLLDADGEGVADLHPEKSVACADNVLRLYVSVTKMFCIELCYFGRGFQNLGNAYRRELRLKRLIS